MPQQVDKYGVPIRTPEQQARLDELARIQKKYPTRQSIGQYETVNPVRKWQWGADGQPELKTVGTDTETGTVAGRKEFRRYEPSDYKNFDPDTGKERRMRRVNSNQITQRDATIAKNARQTLAERASKAAASSNTQQSKTTMSAGAIASTLPKALGVAGIWAASEKAAGETPEQARAMMQRAESDPKSWYNTQGPGSVKRPSYAGQSVMSKLMEEDLKKRGGKK